MSPGARPGSQGPGALTPRVSGEPWGTLTALVHRAVSLPYTSHGLQITPYGQNVQLVAKQVELELVVMWGPDAHLMVRTGPVQGHTGPRCGAQEGRGPNLPWP